MSESEKLAVLLKAAIATADLAQPVRCIRAETDGFILQTAKGENTPARISQQSCDEMSSYFEEIRSFLDKEVAGAEDEDEMPVDLLTAPDWFGHYKYMEAFYVLDDLSFELDPNRSKTLLDPIYKILVHPPEDYAADSPKILGLKAALDGECSQGLSCVYRALYPEVQRAGPVALNPCVIGLLTHGVNVIASTNQTALLELLSAVADILMPANSGGESNTNNDAHQFNSDQKPSTMHPNYCICCILAKQTRSYVDASKEVAYGENQDGVLTDTTLIGVRETIMGKEACEKTETNFFAPTVNIHDHQRCYLADRSPFGEYRLEKRKGSFWVVVRSSLEDSAPSKLQAAVGVVGEYI